MRFEKNKKYFSFIALFFVFQENFQLLVRLNCLSFTNGDCDLDSDLSPSLGLSPMLSRLLNIT